MMDEEDTRHPGRLRSQELQLLPGESIGRCVQKEQIPFRFLYYEEKALVNTPYWPEHIPQYLWVIMMILRVGGRIELIHSHADVDASFIVRSPEMTRRSEWSDSMNESCFRTFGLTCSKSEPLFSSGT